MAKHYSEFRVDADKDPSDELRRLITECNLYQVHPSNEQMFYICKGEGINDSHFSSKSDAHDFVGRRFSFIWKPADAADRFYKLCNQIRNKTSVVYSTRPTNDSELNVMSGQIDADWVKPIYEPSNPEPHPFFPLLMQSLSGDDPEMQRHIERCILVKRFNPWKYDVPVIVFTGSGSVGKQHFGNLLKVLFSGSFIKGSTTDLFSKKNHEVIGKAIVFGNELKVDGRNYDNVKAFIWEGTIRVSMPKGGVVEADNVSWCILASNHIDNPVPITGQGEDRRWTINRNTSGRTLPDYVAEHKIYQNVSDDYDDAEDFMRRDDNLTTIITDPHNIAIWLGYLIRKHGYPLSKQAIQHYKTAEFYRLVDLHKKNSGEVDCEFENRIMRAVLETDHIRYFTTENLVSFYKDNGGVFLAQWNNRRMNDFLKKYVEANALNWDYKEGKPPAWHRKSITKEQYRSMNELAIVGDEWSFSLDDLEVGIEKQIVPEVKAEEFRKLYVYSGSQIEEMSASENDKTFIDPLNKDDEGDYDHQDYIPRIEGSPLFAATPDDSEKLKGKDPAKWRSRFGVPVFRANDPVDKIERNISDYHQICDGLYIRKIDFDKVFS